MQIKYFDGKTATVAEVKAYIDEWGFAVLRDKVDPVTIPESLNVVATYPIASLKAPSSRDTSAIAAFLAMARGAVGDSIFAKAGFIVP